MLKPADPKDERPIGDRLQQLVEDGKAYARAELAVVEAIVKAKGKALVLPLAMFAVAVVFVLAGVTALSIGVVIALTKFLGPFLAGLAGLLIFVAIAGGLGWYAARRLERIF